MVVEHLADPAKTFRELARLLSPAGELIIHTPNLLSLYADKSLVDQVRRAAMEGEFAPEPSPGLFHPNATSSFKQVQFGEANVQLTFHEKDTKKIDGAQCIKVEPDIDCYQDLGAHTILEVIPNSITHGLTDPKEVYVLRWIAGRHAGIPEFDPPYTIASSATGKSLAQTRARPRSTLSE